MIVNETSLSKSCGPAPAIRSRTGDVGEVVVTSFHPDYPIDPVCDRRSFGGPPDRSPCGRTNMRLQGWMGRADQATKVKGMFVHPAQVAQVGKRHPELGRLRPTASPAPASRTPMTLIAESSARADGLQAAVAATLQSVTKLRGEVKFVAPGSLPNRRQGHCRRTAIRVMRGLEPLVDAGRGSGWRRAGAGRSSSGA